MGNARSTGLYLKILLILMYWSAFSGRRKPMQFIKSLTGTALILFTSSALATLITFDDLPERYPPNWQDHPDYGTDFEIVRPMPVTNQYDHLGVNFGSGDLDDIVVGAG